MIEGRNIICIASNYWYDPTSKHHVMRLLAERNHVIWVNYHASRRPTATARDLSAAVGKLRQIARGPRDAGPAMTVITPLVLPLPGNAAARAVNASLLTRQVRGVLRRLPARPVQLWSFAPDVDFLCGRFGEEAVIYYCVDAFSEFSGYDAAAVLEAERRLAARADLLIVTSNHLLRRKRELCPRTLHVPHGVDVANFARATRPDIVVPEDITHLPRPILGFWGMLQDWVDVDLLAAVARARPDWSIVLIGEALVDTAPLAVLQNVHLLGRRPYDALPGYAARMDVGLLPFRVNALTEAVNPIKLREYLAAGLPVVSTPLPEVRAYEAFVRVAANAAEFVKACEAAIGSSDAGGQARQAAMRHEDWRAKVEIISAAVEAARQARSGGVSVGAD